MVDVIMVILVFFMLGASLEVFKEGVFQTELDPRSGPGEGVAIEIIPSVKIALRLSPDGGASAIHVMGRPLAENSAAGLRSFLTARRRAGADPKSPIVVTADARVHWRYVVRAIDAAVQAGFKNVQFAVSLAPEGGGE